MFFINISMGRIHEISKGRIHEISWEEITSKNFVPRRSAIGKEQYDRQVNYIKQRRVTFEDQILEDIFNLDTDAKKKNAKESENPKYKLVRNSFPYWVEGHIVHLLMFTTTNNWDEKTLKQITLAQIKEQAEGLLDTKLFEIFIHINYGVQRTVKNLSHTHVFVKRKNKEAMASDIINKLPYSKPQIEQ